MKKPSPLEGLARILNSAQPPCSPAQVRASLLMRAYVFGKDWGSRGVSPEVIALVVDGMEVVEIANLLNLEKRTVATMLFRADYLLRGQFFDAVVHYHFGDADSALQCMRALGYSSYRQLPVELYDRFKVCRDHYELADCEAELQFLSEYSLARLLNPVSIDQNKVSYLLFLLSSRDPALRMDRARVEQRLVEAGEPSGWDRQSNLAALE
ncbi:hypothetical protein ACF3MZ_13400 [Paenibacillaceae bacterium WGS1546]|uniref:hypothetical protein n=1 Tax=Cohnella sp. WGS1546 TaxID=3366810 RepID=UPI00372D41E3